MTTQAPKKRGRPRKADVEESAANIVLSTSTQTLARFMPDLDAPPLKTKVIKKTTKKPDTTTKVTPKKSAKPSSKLKSKAKASGETESKTRPTSSTEEPLTVTQSFQSKEQEVALLSGTVVDTVSQLSRADLKVPAPSNQALGAQIIDQLQLSSGGPGTIQELTSATKQRRAAVADPILGVKELSSFTTLFDMPAIYRPATSGWRPTLLATQPTIPLRRCRTLSTEQSSSNSQSRAISPSQRIQATSHSPSEDTVAPKKSMPGLHTLKYNPNPTAKAPVQPRQSSQPTISSTNQPSIEKSVLSSRIELPSLGEHLTYKGASRRITSIMVALPFAIFLSYELWQRLVEGKEQRTPIRLSETSKGIENAETR